MRTQIIHILFFISLSYAQDTTTVSQSLSTLYEVVAFTNAYKTFCDTVAPDSGPANTQALADWKVANNVAQIEQLVQQLSATSPDLAKTFEATKTNFVTQMGTYFAGKEATACAEFPSVIKDSSLSSLYPQEMQNLSETLAQSQNPAHSLADIPVVSAPVGSGGLSGLYNYYSSDYSLGADGAVIPDPPKYWYFFPDGYIYKGTLGHEAVNCSTDMTDCDTYVLSGNTITFGDGESKTFSQSGDTLMMGDQKWSYIKPESFTLEGSYESTYGGSEFLNITTFTFRDDGTFSLEGAAGVISVDEQDNGDSTKTTTTATGYDENANTGTYVIRDNNIILSYSDGRVETLTFDYFESAEEGVYGVYLGGTLYY